MVTKKEEKDKGKADQGRRAKTRWTKTRRTRTRKARTKRTGARRTRTRWNKLREQGQGGLNKVNKEDQDKVYYYKEHQDSHGKDSHDSAE